MFDFNSLQNNATQQAEKFANLSGEAFQLNTQFLEQAVTRQSQLFSDLNDANTDYVKSFTEKDPLSNFKTINENYAEDLKTKLTAFTEESVSACQTLQQNFTGICTALLAQPGEEAAQPAAPKAKRTTTTKKAD